MYIKSVHTLIEQGLQNIGVFAYGDVLPEELDLAINARMMKMMDEQVQPLKNTKSKELKFKLQYILDRFQNLQVKKLPCTVTLQSDNSYDAAIPTDYLHLIADISEVMYVCSTANILTGNIVTGNYYLVKGTKSIIYNAVTYITGQIFQGLTGITGYTYSGTGTLLLYQLKLKQVANRLTEEEYLYQVLRNSLEATDIDSPVSALSTNILHVYTEGKFFINQVFLTYLRKPRIVNSQFTTYSNSTNLVIGNKYESVDVPVVYNSVTYSPLTPFVIVSGHLTYTGTASVRDYQNGDVEFTDSMTYSLIDLVILDLSIKTEQSQQKIVNLAQANN